MLPRGDFLQAGRILGQDHDDRGPAVREVSGRDHASSAVVPRPDQHHHSPAREFTPEEDAGHLGQIPSRVLHHLKEIDPQFLDHETIDLSHLLGREARKHLGPHLPERNRDITGPLGHVGTWRPLLLLP